MYSAFLIGELSNPRNFVDFDVHIARIWNGKNFVKGETIVVRNAESSFWDHEAAIVIRSNENTLFVVLFRHEREGDPRLIQIAPENAVSMLEYVENFRGQVIAGHPGYSAFLEGLLGNPRNFIDVEKHDVRCWAGKFFEKGEEIVVKVARSDETAVVVKSTTKRLFVVLFRDERAGEPKITQIFPQYAFPLFEYVTKLLEGDERSLSWL
jgi:hypothetical protein